MSQSKRESNNHTGENSDAKGRIERRLLEAGVRIDRSVNVADGTKKCRGNGHSNPSNQTFPGLIDGNYTVHGGDRLVILDIDVPIEDLPDWVTDLPSTFVVESPHGGYHLYYVVKDDEGISSTTLPCGSVRYDGWYALGPGSTVDHELCDDGKEICPGHGVGEYTETDNPIATLTGAHLEALRDACTESNDVEEFDDSVIENPDDELIALGEQALHDLQNESTPAFNAVMDFLRGGTADFEGDDLTKQNGKINRDTHDTLVISLLYGTLRDVCDYDHANAINIATATLTHYCREHFWTKDGQKRRWLTDGENYRRRIITYALNSFDPERFKLLVEKKGAGMRRDNNEYSELTYEAIWTALYEHLPDNPHHLSNDMDPRNPASEPETRGDGPMSAKDLLPGKEEIIDLAYEIDDGYNEWSSYEEAFRRLQSIYGEVKAARIGNTWVYYPADYPDPPEANYVLQYGEQYDPEEADAINSWTGKPEERDEANPELITDGGTRIKGAEATEDLERIRQVRNGGSELPDGPEVYQCPVEGCERVVIENSGNLRNHVRQSSDPAHRFRSLNEDLELEFDEEAYHSAWGPSSQMRTRTLPLSNSAADTTW